MSANHNKNFEQFLNKTNNEDLTEDEVEVRKGILYFFQREYNSALVQFEKPFKNPTNEITRISAIMKGLCLLKMNELFDSALWFNGWVENSAKENKQEYAIFRDLSLCLADKNVKDIYDTWTVYSHERFEVDHIAEDGKTVVKDKNINAKWPYWEHKNKI